MSAGNNTVIYSSARIRPGYMNGPGLGDTLSAQSENRSGYMNGHMEEQGILVSIVERLENPKFTVGQEL